MNRLAQRITNPAIGDLGGTTGAQFLGKFIPTLISLGLVGGGVIFLFMLIIGGIEWISAGSDKVRVENARKRLSNALIGLIVLFSFFAIINLMEMFLGINLTTIIIGPYYVSFSASSWMGGSGGGGGTGGGG